MRKHPLALYGIFPRTESLVKATQDQERGRISPEELQGFYEQDFRFWLQIQKNHGASPLVDGMLNWDDPFRPLAEIWEGLSPGPLTRFLQTNTFYRPLQTVGPLHLRADILLPWSLKYFRREEEEWAVCLPGPDALHRHFSSFSSNASYALGLKILQPILQFLFSERKFSTFHLCEPWLNLKTLSKEQRKNYASILSDLPSLPYILHPHPISPSALPFYLELPIAGLCVDVTAFPPKDWKDAPWNPEISLYLGIVDMRNSRLEKEEWLKSYLEMVTQHPFLSLEHSLILTVNIDPFFLPAEIAERKFSLLSRLCSDSSLTK